MLRVDAVAISRRISDGTRWNWPNRSGMKSGAMPESVPSTKPSPAAPGSQRVVEIEHVGHHALGLMEKGRAWFPSVA